MPYGPSPIERVVAGGHVKIFDDRRGGDLARADPVDRGEQWKLGLALPDPEEMLHLMRRQDALEDG